MVMTELNRDKILKLLQPYFEKRDDIIMAFLFGSWATNKTCKESDVDIAIYFKPKTGRLEWEDFDARYEEESTIWLDVERLLGRDVDLLMLNRAASSIADSAISGVPIIIKDRGLYLDFMIRVTSEAIDFREFVEEYWRLKEEMRLYAGKTR
ncbi:MAG TPA: type VII toxin-antitoxin system MntA family adenylyltransferase antitoxin [Candidatus Brocadiia bacterium]|nr:nucleotidyltransferase domain-containing protein [Candidatus Brocadiales bacterium]